MKRILTMTAVLLLAALAAQAEVKVAGVFGDHMVLQRERPVPVWGTAAPGEKVAVAFAGQTVTAVADARGAWRVMLAPMKASAAGQGMTVTGANTVKFEDVLIGDVWICSGQSNMDMRLGGCKRPEDIQSADFPGIRHFTSSGGGADEPRKEPGAGDSWVICTPRTASQFTAAGFYFARMLQRELKGAVPQGLMLASVGGTKIDLWLAPEGLYDIPVLHPLLKHRPLADGTFSLFNGKVAPLAPYAARGILWYQGENSEVTVQSPDSYYLKMKALQEGWKRVWGQDDLAFYFVLLANYGVPKPTIKPELHTGGWDADTRLQQVMAMNLPHAGAASAMDIGISKESWAGYHPENKLEVGERLALWALKNEYGRTNTVTSGPVLRNVKLEGNAVVCSFEHVGGGLTVGTKEWYAPMKEVSGGKLQLFSIAGADGKWVVAEAVIRGNTVVLSSAQIPAPRKVSYACWQNVEGANLYNQEGLPAAPFHVEDVTVQHTITATAGAGGSITPAGAAAYLPRATAFYAITPASGYFIQDVKVDGVSVGSVRHYTFDPLQKDHAITATFAKVAPAYTITTSANGGGRIAPSGAVKAAQGATAGFDVQPEPGNRVMLTVDGVALGARDAFTFPDVRRDHTLQATFACTVRATAGFGGVIAPAGEQVVPYGGDQSFTITPNPGYAIASVLVDGKDVGKGATQTLNKITASHTIHVKFAGGPGVAGRIPRPEELVVAVRAEALPAQGEIREWTAQTPAGRTLKPIGKPLVEVVDGRKFASIQRERGDGFTVSTHEEPIPCNGATIVAVARPVRFGASSGWVSIVDVFYDRLVIGIMGDTGKVCVRRNGGVETSDAAIPDGQLAILSFVVQPDGAYKVYANGVEIMARRGGREMKALEPGLEGRGFAKSITLGRNAPDGWTAFNGQIGDVFIYKTALTDDERKELEACIAKALEGPAK